MKNLMPISIDVYNLLLSKGVKEDEILTVINNIQRDIEEHFEVDIEIEEQYFNLLQDIVWYNFERKDTTTLQDIGRLYPSFMTAFDDSDELKYEDISNVKSNLEDIKKKLNKNTCYLVQLSGKDELFQDKSSKIFYIDKRKEKQIDKEKRQKNSITCVIQEDLNSYHMEKIKINNVIDTLLLGIEKAERNHSKIVINFI